MQVGGMIEYMKFDMGGSGAVLGAAKALSALKPEAVEVGPWIFTAHHAATTGHVSTYSYGSIGNCRHSIKVTT